MTARARRRLRWVRRRLFRRRRFARPAPVVSRRGFVTGGALAIAGGAALLSRGMRASAWSSESDTQPVRPPTAGLDDAAFRARCVACGMCGTVCENGCIRYFGVDEPRWGPLTPYLDVRRRSCTLCMRCTEICPTSALTPVPAEPADALPGTIDMGIARVDEDRCLSFLGRICGYCHDACPYPGVAIRLIPHGKPVVLDGCVGCGRCVELCPQHPTAIDVVVEERA